MRKPIMQSFSCIAFDAFIADKLGMSYGQYKAAFGQAEQNAFQEHYFKAFRMAAKRAKNVYVHNYFDVVKLGEQEKSRQERIS